VQTCGQHPLAVHRWGNDREEGPVQIFELLPWAFSVLLLASMLRLALIAFRAGEFAGRQEIFPQPAEAPTEDTAPRA
jgi:hypothetical protein